MNRHPLKNTEGVLSGAMAFIGTTHFFTLTSSHRGADVFNPLFKGL
jgi:hypothetical protein